MARNLTRGGDLGSGVAGKSVRSEIKGLKELEAKLQAMASPQLTREVAGVVEIAGKKAQGIFRSSAQAAGWPASTLKYIFEFGKPEKQRSGKKITALVGVSKGFKTGHIKNPPGHPMYREWGKRTGNIVGMGWSTMLEFGTSRLRARPAIRTAANAARGPIIEVIKNGFQGILNRYTK